MDRRFQRRVTAHRALNWVQDESLAALEILRGLGIDSGVVKALAVVSVAVRYAKRLTSYSSDTTVVHSDVLKRLLHCAFNLRPGWNSVGSMWVFCESDNKHASVDGHTEVLGTEDDLWGLIEGEFAQR